MITDKAFRAGLVRVMPLSIWAFTAIGLLCRLIEIGYSYGGDDFVVLAGLGNSLTTTISWASRINYGPLYFSLLKMFTYVGQGEVITRLLSILCGVLCIPVLYLLSSRLFGTSVGLTAAAILAFSPFHLDQALQLKPATLLALETLVSVYCLIRWIEERRSSWLVGCVLVNVVALYTHYFALFLILFENVAFVIFAWRGQEWHNLRTWALAQASTLVLFAPWATVMLDQITTGRIVGLVPKSSLIFALPELALTFTTGYTAIRFTTITVSKEFLWQDVFANIPVLALWLAAFLPSTVFGLIATIRQREKGLLLLLFLACTLVLPFALVFFPSIGVFSPKLVIGASTGYYLLLALGLVRSPHRKLVVSLVSMIVLLTTYSLLNYYLRDTEFGRRENFRGLIEYVVANEREGDLLVAGSGTQGVQYYLRPYANELVPIYMSPWGNASTQTILDKSIPTAQRVWLVYRVREDSDPNGPWIQVQNRLKRLYRLEQERRFNPALVLYLYERPVL